MGVWNALTLKDDTRGFTQPGINAIYFDPPSSWGFDSAIRWRVTAVAAPISPVQQSRIILTAGRPYIDVNISQAQLTTAQDIRGQMDINFISGSAAIPGTTIDSLFIGGRSLGRGTNFRAYLNCIPPSYLATPFVGFNPDGITFEIGTDVSVILLSTTLNHSVYGNAVTYLNAAGVASAERGYFYIAPDVVNEYLGQFRAMFRRYRVAGSENARWRLIVSDSQTGTTSNTFVSEWVPDTDNPEYSILDFGVIQIPPGNLGANVDATGIYLRLEADVSAVPMQVYMCDLILMPVDEYWIKVTQKISTDMILGVDGMVVRLGSLADDDPLKVIILSGNRQLYVPVYSMSGPLVASLDHPLRYWFLTGTYVAGCTNNLRRYNPEQAVSVTARFQARFPMMAV